MAKEIPRRDKAISNWLIEINWNHYYFKTVATFSTEATFSVLVTFSAASPGLATPHRTLMATTTAAGAIKAAT
jgi:hypothetical protein